MCSKQQGFGSVSCVLAFDELASRLITQVRVPLHGVSGVDSESHEQRDRLDCDNRLLQQQIEPAIA